jgi:hypothetical protein
MRIDYPEELYAIAVEEQPEETAPTGKVFEATYELQPYFTKAYAHREGADEDGVAEIAIYKLDRVVKTILQENILEQTCESSSAN